MIEYLRREPPSELEALQHKISLRFAPINVPEQKKLGTRQYPTSIEYKTFLERFVTLLEHLPTRGLGDMQIVSQIDLSAESFAQGIQVQKRGENWYDIIISIHATNEELQTFIDAFLQKNLTIYPQ